MANYEGIQDYLDCHSRTTLLESRRNLGSSQEAHLLLDGDGWYSVMYVDSRKTAVVRSYFFDGQKARAAMKEWLDR